MQRLASLSLFFHSQHFFTPTFWYLLFGGLSISEKAVKSWVENEDQVQNHYENEHYHKEEEEEEENEDVAP